MIHIIRGRKDNCNQHTLIIKRGNEFSIVSYNLVVDRKVTMIQVGQKLAIHVT